MKISKAIILVLSLSIASFTYADDEVEHEISLKELPKLVQEAAQDAVPGIQLEEAEYTEKNGTRIYEVEGEVKEQDYEMLIHEDGKVIKIEEDDDGESDDDDNEDN